MKDKILFLVIGFLIGAIVATSGFLIYNKVLRENQKQPEMIQMDENGQSKLTRNGNKGERPSMPNQNGEIPPEIPKGSNNKI